MKSLGIVFPGQGSQYVGMLKDIANEFPEIQKTFSDASQVCGYDLWSLVQQGPATELDKTIHTQPALLTASYAIWKIIKEKKIVQPALLAGHSLGEYTALVCAEALNFQDAVRLVAARGQYMQEAVPVGIGALAAIVGLDDNVVITLCEKARLNNEVLSPANFNSLGQIVIGGHKIAVERALVLAKEAGAKLAMLLPVSVPSHCILMKPAADRLKTLLNTISFQPLKIPVLNNVDVKFYSDPDSIRDGLTRQLFNPVRWVETIQVFIKEGIKTVIECGPGKILSGLNKRIAVDLQLSNTSDIRNLQALVKEQDNVSER